MLQGLESSGVPREESGAPINNTWVYPAATALPYMCTGYLLLHSYCMAVSW